MLVLSVYLFFWLVGKDVELYLFMNHDIYMYIPYRLNGDAHSSPVQKCHL